MTWIHKEDEWYLDGTWETTAGTGVANHFVKSLELGWEGKNYAGLTFTQWLDTECKMDGGWEVLKISRNFRSLDKRTWVVFRQQI